MRAYENRRNEHKITNKKNKKERIYISKLDKYKEIIDRKKVILITGVT